LTERAMRQETFLLLASAIVLTSGLQAQEALIRPRTELDSAGFAELQTAVGKPERIRVTTLTGDGLTILHPRLSPDSVVGESGNPIRPFSRLAFKDVRAIQVPYNDRNAGALRGALIGFVLGAVGGGVATHEVSRICFMGCGTPSSTSDDVRGALTGGVFVGVMGALIGTTIGVTKWKAVYSSSSQQPMASPRYTVIMEPSPVGRDRVRVGLSVKF
jgi:hypothetical protein